MYIKKTAGFTLVELMVVIAIIAILATVVLVSLQGARDAAEDTTRIAALSQLRSFPTKERIEEVKSEYGEEGEDILELNIDKEEEKYCAKIELKEGGYFCIDGEGFADKIDDPDCIDHGVCNLDK